MNSGAKFGKWGGLGQLIGIQGHGCSSVTIGRMDGPTTPLLRVCSNRPHGWTDHTTGARL